FRAVLRKFIRVNRQNSSRFHRLYRWRALSVHAHATERFKTRFLEIIIRRVTWLLVETWVVVRTARSLPSSGRRLLALGQGVTSFAIKVAKMFGLDEVKAGRLDPTE